MGIEKFDKNFIIEKGSADGKAVYAIPHPAFALHGVFYDAENGCFARLPFQIAQMVNDGVAHFNDLALAKQMHEIKITFKGLV